MRNSEQNTKHNFVNEATVQMAGWSVRLFLPHLVKLVLLAVAVLVLYGVLPAGHLALVLGLFIIVRGSFLTAEALRRPPTPEHWLAITDNLARAFESASQNERDAVAPLLGLPAGAQPRTLAEARVRQIASSYVPPRPRWELLAEALGLVAFAALLPADVALWTNDFFSLRMPLGWLAAAVSVASIGLYALPRFLSKRMSIPSWKILWWGVPFVPLCAVFLGGVALRHPYLNALDPAHKRLAAERVLRLNNIIVAGRHADWVARYAGQLEDRGDFALAAAYYREALRLDPGNREVRQRLAILAGINPLAELGATGANNVSVTARYWTNGQIFAKPPRCRIDNSLESLEECSVVIVLVGEVPEMVVDAVAHAVRNELHLPVLLSTSVVPLPGHDRVRGLVTGKQWSEATLVSAFMKIHQPLPVAPVRYLLLTPVDIYGLGANYTFSLVYQFGAMVSLARFAGPGADDSILCHRTAKQSLCALIKSFPVPPSPDRNCVTSYARSLEDFDAKGNRPCRDTEVLFQQAVAEMNRQWKVFKSSK